MTSFNGVEGSYSVEGDPVTLTYKTGITSVKDDPENRQGVYEGDLSEYKDSSYFDAYVDTFSVVYLKNSDTTLNQVIISTKDKESKPIAVARVEAYNTLKSLHFGSLESAKFGKSITVKGNGSSITVRNTSISIPGVLSVSKGSKGVTQQSEIGGIAVMKYEGTNYDFYQYGDNLIKAAKGIAIENYITLESL